MVLPYWIVDPDARVVAADGDPTMNAWRFLAFARIEWLPGGAARAVRARSRSVLC
jgi:hypothetical protein